MIGVVNHIENIVDLNHLGIGSEFRVILSGTTLKWDNIKRIWNRGFDDNEIRGITGDNFRKVVKRVFDLH